MSCELKNAPRGSRSGGRDLCCRSGPTAGKEEKLAVVRPWLQDFTASYLEHYITYGPEQVKAQIQAVYDAGYEEWIFWDAACTYEWKGLEKEN